MRCPYFVCGALCKARLASGVRVRDGGFLRKKLEIVALRGLEMINRLNYGETK